MKRELPRGPFDAYLRAHYFNDAPGVLPRFAMGSGAIFMIQRVAPLDSSLTARSAAAETDPLLLGEMVSLVAAQGLDVVSLGEMRRRLVEGELDRRFVAFTFDGAYRSILTAVLPLFEKRGMPFAVYAGSDFLRAGTLPWWLALDGLVKANDRLSIEIEGERMEMRCRSFEERQQTYSDVHRRLARLESANRTVIIETECRKHGVDLAGLAEREMLGAKELKALHEDGLVTVGSNGGGLQALPELSFDGAQESLGGSLAVLEAATGSRPRHLAFPVSMKAGATARDVKIARDLGLETAVTSIEGALWPEHARELHALPRIALDNNPATLVRAIMLGGDAGRHPRGMRSRMNVA